MDIITYALSKKYTDDTTIGLGALKGAPCTISNISETDTEITLTLSWTGTDGTSETSVLTIPKGQDGEDGVTPFASVARNADDDGAVITITDAVGTTQVTVKDGQSGGGIQKEELPAAAAENVGEIYQYIGATTDTLTSGFFYECVSNEDGTYSWTEKQVSQGAADYNELDNIPLSLDDEENVIVNEKYSDFFDELKNVDIPKEVAMMTHEEYLNLSDEDKQKDILYIAYDMKKFYYKDRLLNTGCKGFINAPDSAESFNNSVAIGEESHAEGQSTEANAKGSHTEGKGTIAAGDYQHVQGKYNAEDVEGRYAHIIGNGTGAGTSRRKNAHTVDWSGNAWYKGDVRVGGTSYDDAEALATQTFVDEQLYTTTTVEAHYKKAEVGATGALEVVADDATAAEGQINVGNVTPVLDGEVVAAGDYVIWVEAVETKDAKFLVEADLDPYVAEEEIKVMTEEELLEKLGLSEEELQGLAQLISDTEVRIDKTYSSSKIYTELNRVLEEGKTYTLEEIAKSSGASYKIAGSTTEMTSTKYIYLLANGDTYDMYICEEENSTPVKIGTTSVTLTDYYTKTECDERYVLATAFELLNNSIGNVNNLQTTSKVIVDAINEVVISVDGMSTTVTETKDALGDITALETEAKDNVVNAVNEVKKSIDEFETYVELTQEEYDALADDETGKFNGTEYRTTDTGRIYKNGVQYGGQEPEVIEGFAKYKEMKEAGLIDPDAEYLVTSDENGILLNGSDVGYNNAESGIQATTVQGAIDKVAEKVDGLIDNTNLTSTTSTLSANKIKNAVTYSFDTQSGNVKYIKFKPSVTPISVVDIYGGKIEILGASKTVSNPDYKTVKVVRLSYGDWGSYDATQVPSVVHTKIGELYYYPTDEYYYLKLYNYSAFTMTGLATAPEIITSLPAEESAMTLIPESVFASKSALATKLDKGYITGITDANNAIGENGVNIFAMSASSANMPLSRTGVIRSYTTIEDKYIRVNQEYSTIDNSPQNGGTYKRYGSSDDGGATFTWSNWNFVASLDDSTTASLKTWSSSKITEEITNRAVTGATINDSATNTTSVWSSSKTKSYVDTLHPSYTSVAKGASYDTGWKIKSVTNGDMCRIAVVNIYDYSQSSGGNKMASYLYLITANYTNTTTLNMIKIVSTGNPETDGLFEFSVSSNGTIVFTNKSSAATDKIWVKLIKP